MSFKDHFSAIATRYAQYRPHYPAELFTYPASQCPGHDRAVDCGTGNGQAAMGLAPHFHEVIATDPSVDQIASAVNHDRITYHVAAAEAMPVADRSVDLVTAAAAAHWFNHEAFHAEARRVLKSGGVIACWTYWNADISPAVNAVLERFQFTLVGPYWPPERAFVNSAYRTLPFPFDGITAPEFEVSAVWTLDHFIGYLGTWSAVQRYKQEHGTDPVELAISDLRAAWGTAERTVHWPLAMCIGRV